MKFEICFVNAQDPFHNYATIFARCYYQVKSPFFGVSTPTYSLLQPRNEFLVHQPVYKLWSIILKNQERNPTPPEDIDPDLFIGADDVVDEDEDDAAGVGLVDNVAVELVSRLNIGTVNLITL